MHICCQNGSAQNVYMAAMQNTLHTVSFYITLSYQMESINVNTINGNHFVSCERMNKLTTPWVSYFNPMNFSNLFQ